MYGSTSDERADDGPAGYHRLQCAALVLGLLTAGIHLAWGIPRFTNYVSVGAMPDPRPLLFVLSGHAILAGVTLASLGVVDPRRTYLPGIGLMLAHVAGYVGWHTVYRHGLAETGSHATDVVHVDSPVVVVLDHLLNSPIALASKSAEVAVIGLLAALYAVERRR